MKRPTQQRRRDGSRNETATIAERRNEKGPIAFPTAQISSIKCSKIDLPIHFQENDSFAV